MGIFRSDTVAPGDRVVVRRRIGKAHSDVIGHVISRDAAGLVVRPQEAGGYPSFLPEIAIPEEQIQVVKRLSPRTVRNSDIRAIEVATAKAFPGIEHRWVGPWLLRAGDGITERSNSAAPLGPTAGLSEVPFEAIMQFYAQHSLPPRVLIPDRIGRSAQRYCVGPQWELGPEIIVMAKDLAPGAPAAEDSPQAAAAQGASAGEPAARIPQDKVLDVEFRVDEQPDAEWLRLYHFRGHPLPEHALQLLRQRIDGVMGFGRLLHRGATVAITRGTITDGMLGYSAVEVAEGFRRRGLGTLLGSHMLLWGASEGAQRAYLQVIASNEAGIALYRKLGFLEHHRHRYATLHPQSEPARPERPGAVS